MLGRSTSGFHRTDQVDTDFCTKLEAKREVLCWASRMKRLSLHVHPTESRLGGGRGGIDTRKGPKILFYRMWRGFLLLMCCCLARPMVSKMGLTTFQQHGTDRSNRSDRSYSHSSFMIYSRSFRTDIFLILNNLLLMVPGRGRLSRMIYKVYQVPGRVCFLDWML